MDFQVATGSVRGAYHTSRHLNNQDALHVERIPGALVAIVTDGCGSSAHSEVGAKLGARMVAAAIMRDLAFRPFSSEPDWERITYDVRVELANLVKQMGGQYAQTIADYFLFTVVGCLIQPGETIFFSAGDGVVAVNGLLCQIPPLTGNRPPYLAYGLIPQHVDPDVLAQSQLAERVRLPTYQLHTWLVGTDGVADLANAITEGKASPRTGRPLESLERLWEADRYYKPSVPVLERQLRLLAEPHSRTDWEEQRTLTRPPILHDDTTMIIGRRTPTS